MSWPPPATRRFSCPDCKDGRLKHATKHHVPRRKFQNPWEPDFVVRYHPCPNQRQSDHQVVKL